MGAVEAFIIFGSEIRKLLIAKDFSLFECCEEIFCLISRRGDEGGREQEAKSCFSQPYPDCLGNG